ncbi:MAG: TlpA disulfide reductase family protein [Nitrospirota bacterium]
MLKKPLLIMAAIFCLTGLTQVRDASGRTPAAGESFPDLTFDKSDNSAVQEYLGWQGKGPFRLSQIKADIIIIEVFSMYCPYCQKEAPIVNKLYDTISKRGDLRKRIKLIGIGAGNTSFEVDVFRKEYGILFPLFPDESFDVHKKVGEVRTPYFFVMKINPDGSNKLIYSRVGSIQDHDRFLELILRESGLK